jgi:hypothetical protein
VTNAIGVIRANFATFISIFSDRRFDFHLVPVLWNDLSMKNCEYLVLWKVIICNYWKARYLLAADATQQGNAMKRPRSCTSQNRAISLSLP